MILIYCASYYLNGDVFMNIDELKHKLRKFKKFELDLKTRNHFEKKSSTLIWNKFFSTNSFNDSSVKYSLCELLKMDPIKIKEIINEYFYEVYYHQYIESGLSSKDMFDPKLLALMGLPLASSIDDIKSKFRELAKKFHPDTGGNADKFIELMKAYEKLIDD